MNYALFIEVADLINVRDAEDAAHHGAQFHIVMYEEIDSCRYNLILCHGVQVVDAKMQFVGYAVNDIAEQMLAVNGLQCDGGRVEYVALRLVVNSDDAVAVSCGKAYGFRTVAAVHSDTIIIVLEAYDLFAWYWVTTRTSAVLRTRFPAKVHVYVLQCLG